MEQMETLQAWDFESKANSTYKAERGGIYTENRNPKRWSA
jgi:hypothetical protein